MGKGYKSDIKATALVVGSKLAVEQILKPYLGNGTLKSGAIKTALGVVLGQAGLGKNMAYVSTGIVTDGIEDIFVGLMNKTGIGASAGTPAASNVAGFNL